MEQPEDSNLLNQAYNSLIQIYNRDLWTSVPQGNLYHYTSAEGLLGIIESRCLHASLAYLLNDASELSYGCSIVLSAIDEARTSYSNAAFVQRLLDDLSAGFSFESNRATWAHSIFVACFCENDNLLSQWRAYGSSGGYSLGLAISTSNTRLHPEPKTYTNRLIKVVYDRDTQIRTCVGLLADIVRTVDGIQTAVANQDQYSFLRYETFYELIQDLVIEAIVGFKNPAFAGEQEWRLVARERKLMKQRVDDGGKSPSEVYFRTSRGLVVPYIKLVPKQNPALPGAAPFPLSSIRFGPMLNRAKGERALRRLLEMRGLPGDVAIVGSEIPVLL